MITVRLWFWGTRPDPQLPPGDTSKISYFWAYRDIEMPLPPTKDSLIELESGDVVRVLGDRDMSSGEHRWSMKHQRYSARISVYGMSPDKVVAMDFVAKNNFTVDPRSTS